MDLSSFLTFLGERTFFVSITILVLLAIRPLAKSCLETACIFCGSF